VRSRRVVYAVAAAAAAGPALEEAELREELPVLEQLDALLAEEGHARNAFSFARW
jgi:hypothetical protein